MKFHLERFNRVIQEEFGDYRTGELLNVKSFNRKLIDWLIWYNTKKGILGSSKQIISGTIYVVNKSEQQLVVLFEGLCKEEMAEIIQ